MIFGVTIYLKKIRIIFYGTYRHNYSSKRKFCLVCLIFVNPLCLLDICQSAFSLINSEIQKFSVIVFSMSRLYYFS